MDPKTSREVYDWAGMFVMELVRATRMPHDTTVLDVGAGQGKYGYLLHDYTVDAVEVWEPYVELNDLANVYRDVYVTDVYVFISRLTRRYDVVIFGDVLEHLTTRSAQFVLEKTLAVSDEVIVVVPYLYAQGPEHGNDHQRHLQADLTPEVMTRRYPRLELVALETRNFCPFKGVYRGRT